MYTLTRPARERPLWREAIMREGRFFDFYGGHVVRDHGDATARDGEEIVVAVMTVAEWEAFSGKLDGQPNEAA